MLTRRHQSCLVWLCTAFRYVIRLYFKDPCGAARRGAAHLRDEITVVISLPHRRSPTLFFGGALRDIQKTAARKTMFLLACSQTLYFLLTARAKGSGWTVVFSVWACATAEQAMYMEAHHRVCLHQNLRVSKPLSRLFFSLVLGNVLVI